MEDEIKDDADISKEQEEADLNAAEQDESESVEEYKTRLAKAEELAKNYKIRAEKAEKLAKQKPSEESKQVVQGIDDETIARIYGIHEDDFQEVKDMATFKKISIAEALKLPATKAILAEKAEFRKTAEVSNTGNARRGATKVSDDILLKNLAQGKIPEAGTPEAEALFWAKRGGKR